jgi:hypothetical protein
MGLFKEEEEGRNSYVNLKYSVNRNEISRLIIHEPLQYIII